MHMLDYVTRRVHMCTGVLPDSAEFFVFDWISFDSDASSLIGCPSTPIRRL